MTREPTRETTPGGPVRGIGALDRVAEQLADEAGVELGVADSGAELIAVHRLRYRDAAEHGRATVEDDRDGLQSDAFDTRALQIYARDGRALQRAQARRRGPRARRRTRRGAARPSIG